MKKNANKGFSLVELIIVIAIMAVLIGVLAPQFIKHVENSRQSTDLDNVQAIKTAIEAAVADDDNITAASISINGGTGGTITFTVTGGSLEGVTSGAKLKSNGWPEGPTTYTYYFADDGTNKQYTWGAAPASCENGKGKKQNMKTIFE